jgi:hypothetical protein
MLCCRAQLKESSHGLRISIVLVLVELYAFEVVEKLDYCQDSTLGRISRTLEFFACATSPQYIIRIASLPLKASDSS